jgi:hypothetical protein
MYVRKVQISVFYDSFDNQFVPFTAKHSLPFLAETLLTDTALLMIDFQMKLDESSS